MNLLKDYSKEKHVRDTDALFELYGNGVPESLPLAVNGLCWFLSGGKRFQFKGFDNIDLSDGEDIDDEFDSLQSKNDEVRYDFDYDSNLIWSCMLTQYGVDISKEQIHWFKFLAMFEGLNNTLLNDLMHYRTMDLSEYKDEKLRSKMAQLKEVSRVKGIKMTPEQVEEYKVLYKAEWKKYARRRGFVVPDEN